MALPTRHIFSQGPVLASLGGTALFALRQRIVGGKNDLAAPVAPGPELRSIVAPLPDDLIRDYVRHVGGDPSAYRGVVPPHLFPQWGFPLAAKTLRGLPYPMAKVLNGGCRLEINGDLPAGEPLHVRARLEDIDDNGRRAVLHQRVSTGTAEDPELVVGHLYAIVPLGKPATGKGGSDGKGKERSGAGGSKNGGNGKAADGKKLAPRVPEDVAELAYLRIPSNAGLAFAMLTGDFNPVHWVAPYARAFGFRSTILHGFSTMARAIEGIHRGVFAGDTRRISVFDCKFTKPLLLPARVGLYLKDREVFVGDAPGASAYLTGNFRTRG